MVARMRRGCRRCAIRSPRWMCATPTRGLLSSIVEAMVTAEQPRIVTVAPRLMAYGRALQHAAKWPLAADVYRTVLAYATPVDDAETVIAANMQLGRCLRVMAEWEEALACFAAASQVATMTDDVMSILRARIQEANIAIDRGNLPYAETLLDETIVQAKESGLRRVGATAMHDRAHLALRRGKPTEAVVWQYEAFKGVRNQMARDRVLNDLGASFVAARHVQCGARCVPGGCRDGAGAVHALDGNDQLARRRGGRAREPLFEQYRRDLEDVAFAASAGRVLLHFVAKGYRAFDQAARSQRPRSSARSSSRPQIKLGQALFEGRGIARMKLERRASVRRAQDAARASAATMVARSARRSRTALTSFGRWLA